MSETRCEHPSWTEEGDGHGHNHWQCTKCDHTQWIAPWGNARCAMTPLIDWDDPDWGGHIHIASSDDLGKHGKHSDDEADQ